MKIIGRGFFGVVSLAKWNGALVVVKKLHQQSSEAVKEIKEEATRLSEVSHHPCVISFIGFLEGDYPALITTYAKYGSVQQCIIENKDLYFNVNKEMKGILQVGSTFIL